MRLVPYTLKGRFLLAITAASLLVLLAALYGYGRLDGLNREILGSMEKDLRQLKADLVMQEAIAQARELSRVIATSADADLDDRFLAAQARLLADKHALYRQLLSAEMLALYGNEIEHSWQQVMRQLEAFRPTAEARYQLTAALAELQHNLDNLVSTPLEDVVKLKARADQTSRQTRWLSLLGALLSVVIAATLVLRVGALAACKLRRLQQAMQSVGKGDLTRRVPLDGADELDDLGLHFNEMVANLDLSNKTITTLGERYRAITEAAADSIITTDEAGDILSWNAASEALFGFTRDEAEGRNIGIILPQNLRADHHQYMQRYLQQSSSRKVVGAGARELMGVRKDGIQVPIEVSITEMHLEGKRQFVGIIRDISERKAAAEKVAYLTQYDTLTHLPNRSLLREHLVEAMERAVRSERLVGVIQLDLDRFMSINDSLGHDIGDELLVAVSERIRQCLRGGDHLARMGGDEFCILLEGMKHVMEASMMAAQLLEVLDRPFELQGHHVYITASIGIAVFPFDEESPEVLFKNADAAMHRCKSEGGNHYTFYSEDMNARNLERVKLTADLRHALEQDQFVLYYQPQIDMKTGRAVGAEALIRWRHPELGLVSPGQFIPILEETGMIMPVGEWAIREACRQNAEWHGQGFERFRVAINLSVRQFRDRKLVDVLTDVFEETRMDPSLFNAGFAASTPLAVRECLELELTEGLLMENTGSSCEILDAFKQMGIKLSVDDFGTGYSSLSYLKQFPLDTLKIDQSFVRDVGQGQDSELIIQAIIDLAHNLRLEVIGEGVETEQQLAFLREKGCDQIQGYLVARPMPPQEMQAWMDAWKPADFLAGMASR